MRSLPRRRIALFCLAAFLLAFAAGCSSKGVHMPKHRKRRHCDCPTFSQAVAPQADSFVVYAAATSPDGSRI